MYILGFMGDDFHQKISCRDLSKRHSAHVIGGQKIDVEKFDKKINFGIWRRKVMDDLIQIDLDIVLKNKRNLYDKET